MESFYAKYLALCKLHNIEPCGQQIANALGTTRASIASWGRRDTPPRAAVLVSIANLMHVTVDYLLGRTEDPTDYTDIKSIYETAAKGNISSEDLKHIEDLINKSQRADSVQEHLFRRLDDIDRGKAEAFVRGLLSSDKYASRGQK